MGLSLSISAYGTCRGRYQYALNQKEEADVQVAELKSPDRHHCGTVGQLVEGERISPAIHQPHGAFSSPVVPLQMEDSAPILDAYATIQVG